MRYDLHFFFQKVNKFRIKTRKIINTHTELIAVNIKNKNTRVKKKTKQTRSQRIKFYEMSYFIPATFCLHTGVGFMQFTIQKTTKKKRKTKKSSSLKTPYPLQFKNETRRYFYWIVNFIHNKYIFTFHITLTKQFMSLRTAEQQKCGKRAYEVVSCIIAKSPLKI
jgi:hypothetical protein